MYNQSYNDIKREINYPENSEKLAELVGIIFGDGCMNIYGNSSKVEAFLIISGHSINDRDYLILYVSKLIKELFNISPSANFKKNQNTMYLRLGSKGIVNFLVSKGVCLGPKYSLIIPKWIFEKEEYMDSFLKGLMDTDGSLAIKKRHKNIPYYPTLKIVSKCKKLIKSVSIYLLNKGFTPYTFLDMANKRYSKSFTISGVELNGYPKLVLWLEKIGFSNSKHINKVELVKKQRKSLKRSYNNFV